MAIILQTKLESVASSQQHYPESMRAGYALFASGIIVGFANLVCGYVEKVTHLHMLITLRSIRCPAVGSILSVSVTVFPLFNFQSKHAAFEIKKQEFCITREYQLKILQCTSNFSFPSIRT